MVRGRRTAKRDAAQNRQSDQLAREAAAAKAAQRLVDRWGGDHEALKRLGALSTELERLHKQETVLLRERDQLVRDLRETGSSWASLSSRTRLSRQALMKRAAS